MKKQMTRDFETRKRYITHTNRIKICIPKADYIYLQEYSQLIGENIKLRKSLDKMRNDYKHAMKELTHANEDRESLEFEINSVWSGLNNQLKHSKAATKQIMREREKR